MAEKPSPLVEALTRALIPPSPGEEEKREVYEQAGRAVIELSNAENLLVVIFCIVSGPVPIEAAKEMFASQGSFDRKSKLVDFMIQHADKPKEMALWKEVYKELNTHRGVRNLIAHQRMIISYNPDTPKADVALTPLFHSRKGRRLRAADIKSTADELKDVNAKLWKLVGELSAS